MHARVSTTNLLTNLNLTPFQNRKPFKTTFNPSFIQLKFGLLFIGCFFVRVVEQISLVDVVKALLKVKVAERVLLQIPNVQVRVGHLGSLDDRHGHFVAVAADAQVSQRPEIRQLRFQIHRATDRFRLS